MQAIMAAIVELSALNEATLANDPQKPSCQGADQTWIDSATEWMEEVGWCSSTEAHELQSKAKDTYQKHRLSLSTRLVVDFGEGWRSVGRALKEEDPGLEVVGIDRRLHVSTGAKHGTITAAIQYDFSVHPDCTTDTPRRIIERKVGRSTAQWVMAWMSPDCTLWSHGNNMNQTKGTARGLKAQRPLNMAAATSERLASELQAVREGRDAVAFLLTFLEQSPRLLFAMENPFLSDLWNLPEVKEALQRNKDWKLTRVDQCAYGRR